MRDNPFSSRVLLSLVGVGVVSLLVALGYVIFGAPPASEPSAQNDSFSRSALGHNAFLQMVRKLGIPVVVSHYDSGTRAQNATLVVLEPDHLESIDLVAMVNQAPRTLLVLPKWSGEPDEKNPEILGSVARKSSATVEEVLNKFVADGRVTDGAAGSEKWEGLEDQVPTLTAPQLMLSAEIVPIVQTRSGILFGQIDLDDGTLWILSDPDLLNNHGLHHGNNALIVAALLDKMRADMPLVIDEAGHGYRVEPSIWRELLSFPLVLVTVQVLLLGLALLWAALYRFGRPLDQGTGLAAGGELLIENSAALLLSGGHAAHTVDRYLEQAESAVSRRLRVPTTLNRAAQIGWLENVGKSRGLTRTLREVRQKLAAVVNSDKTSSRGLVEVAGYIHQWKEEMLYGRSNSGPRGPGTAPPDP